MSADQIHEHRNELLGFHDDGTAMYGDILELRRGNRAEWLFMGEGELDNPQLRTLALRLLVRQADEAMA
jgi:hypothetical protein